MIRSHNYVSYKTQEITKASETRILNLTMMDR